MDFSMEIGGAHATVKARPDGLVEVAIDATGTEADFGSVRFRADLGELDVFGRAASLVAKRSTHRARALDLRRFAEAAANGARLARDFGDAWRGGYYDRIASEAFGLAEAAEKVARQAEAELSEMKAERAETAVAR